MFQLRFEQCTLRQIQACKFAATGVRNLLQQVCFVPVHSYCTYTGRFIIFSLITNIYNKKTKRPTLMKLFTATGKLKKVFVWQLEIFDACSTGETVHIDTIFKLLPHTRQDACVATTWISYRCVPCHPCCTHRTSLVVKQKTFFQFSCGCEQFH